MTNPVRTMTCHLLYNQAPSGVLQHRMLITNTWLTSVIPLAASTRLHVVVSLIVRHFPAWIMVRWTCWIDYCSVLSLFLTSFCTGVPPRWSRSHKRELLGIIGSSFYRLNAPCRLRGVMCPWFICWLLRYICCLLVFTWLPVLTIFFSLLIFPHLPTSLLTFSFENRSTSFPGGHKRRPNLGLGCFGLFWVIIFLCSWYMVILRCSKFSYLR